MLQLHTVSFFSTIRPFLHRILWVFLCTWLGVVLQLLRQQREALLAERGRYTQHAEFLEAEADQLARDREPGDVQFDEESGEGDSIAVERDRDLQLSAQARAAIQEIDDALERIKKDTYGICVASGLPIPKERLEAIPHADMRVEEKATGMSWR